MENIAVSVIVPIYNAQAQLRVCLDSILSQTLPELEVIAVNDGSTDGSREILEEYRRTHPQRFRVIHQENGGPSAARNAALRIARGRCVGFVDSDDYIHPQMYDILYRRIRADKSDLAVCQRFNLVQGKAQEHPLKPPLRGRETAENESPAQLSFLLQNLTLFIWDKLFDMEIIRQNALQFPPGCHYAEDFAFLAQYLYHTRRVSLVQEALYYYRDDSSDSITNSFTDRWFDIFRSLEQVNRFYIEKNLFYPLENTLLAVEFGYFDRRINQLHRHRGKRRQTQFLCTAYAFFDRCFCGWRERVQKFPWAADAARKIDPGFMRLYIYTPNRIKKLWIEGARLLPKLQKRLKRIRAVLRGSALRYAYFRKRCAVVPNSVLFLSYSGAAITGNPYYMMRELLKDSRFSVFAGTRSPHHARLFLRFNGLAPTAVKLPSGRFLRLLASAEYLVCNSRMPDYFSKRPGQVLVNTWHGTPLKTLGRHMESGLQDLGNNQSQFLMSDCLLCPNAYTQAHIMDAFCLNELFGGRVLRCGYPRSEVFFDGSKTQALRESLGLTGKRILAYMPTWRGESIHGLDIDAYQSTTAQLLAQIDEALDENTVLYVKFHQLIMQKMKLSQYRHIRPFHDFYETYQFLNLADVLITDYSSVFFDFANTGREIVLFLYDCEQYLRERGMYLDVQQLPFRKLYSTQELLDYLRAAPVPPEPYADFRREYCALDSADCAERVNDVIFRQQNNPQALTDYSANCGKRWNIIFAGNLTNLTPPETAQFFHSLRPNDLPVFPQNGFHRSTDSLLRQYRDCIPRLVIIPGNPPFTLGERARIYLYRFTRLGKQHVKQIYRDEMARILPGIAWNGIQNLSADKKLRDIAALLG